MWGRCEVDVRSIIIYEGERLVTSPSPIFVTFWSLVYYQSACGSNQKMWNSTQHYNLLQQGAGNYDHCEESDFSQEREVSPASHGKESSQEETEHLLKWSEFLMKPRNATKPSSTLWSINTKTTEIKKTWFALKSRMLFFLFTEKNWEKYS